MNTGHQGIQPIVIITNNYKTVNILNMTNLPEKIVNRILTVFTAMALINSGIYIGKIEEDGSYTNSDEDKQQFLVRGVLTRLFDKSHVSQNKSNDSQTECDGRSCVHINQKIINIRNFHDNLRNLKAIINDTIANKISAVNIKNLDFLRTENVGEIISTIPNQPADKLTNRSERILNHTISIEDIFIILAYNIGFTFKHAKLELKV